MASPRIILSILYPGEFLHNRISVIGPNGFVWCAVVPRGTPNKNQAKSLLMKTT
jgi:hypothetical protein